MMETLKYWLEQGADGFRIDAINHMFETVGLPNELYVDENGDKSSYDNLIHNHTMNLVSISTLIHNCVCLIPFINHDDYFF